MEAKRLQLDNTDRKIIRILSQNSRTSFLEIARDCGMSGAAIHQRVNKLIEHGIIEKYGLNLSPEALGFTTCAYVGVFLEKAQMYGEVVEAFKEIPEIVQCHYTTGNYAIFVKLYCKNNNHLMEVLNGMIQNTPGVTSTETFISLEQAISRHIQP